MDLLIYLQILIFYLLNLNLSDVFAIDCYQCISSNKTDGIGCRTPDQWTAPYIKQCRQHIAGQHQDAFACVKIIETIEEMGKPGIIQERIIRDCTSVPLKTGCVKREVSNFKLYKRANVIMTQCVHVCQEADGCNSSTSLNLSSLICLISVIVSAIVF